MRVSASGRRWAGRACLLLMMAAGSSIVFGQATPPPRSAPSAQTPPSVETSPLRLVSTAWPPFTNQPGQPRFALDLVEAALGRIGVSSTTTIVDAAQFTASLLKGDFDGSAAAWKDAERERVLVFSQPYLENRLVLVGRKGADVSATALSALAGKRISIVEGYSYGDAVEGAGPTFVRAHSEEDSLARLLNGSVDYVLMDDLVVQYISSHHAQEAQAKLQLGSTPLVTRPLYFVVRRTRPDAQAIVDRFNGQLRGMVADRTYHRLLHVDWIQADVDNDGLVEYVPGSDRAGAAAPRSAYSLFTNDRPALTATPQPKPSPAIQQPRFYIGGNIYRDWATVPDTYKLTGEDIPNPARSTATLFRFAW
jgi:polar amino acid transport system substrate-binding protein